MNIGKERECIMEFLLPQTGQFCVTGCWKFGHDEGLLFPQYAVFCAY